MEMNTDTEFHKIEGTIEGKIPNATRKGRGPFGNFQIGGERYTCWSETYWESYNPGDNVVVSFIEKENEFNGKVYVNRNVTWMAVDSEDEGSSKKSPFSKSEKEYLKQEIDPKKVDKLADPPTRMVSRDGVITLCGLKYRVKDIVLELLHEQE